MLLCLALACYLLNSMPYSYTDSAFKIEFGLLASVIDFGANSIPGMFMLFCHAVFQEGKKFPRWLGIAFAAQMFIEQALHRSYNAGLLGTLNGWGESTLVQFLFFPLPDLLMLTFTAYAVYWTIKDWRNDLVEDRRLIRWVFLGVLGSAIFVIVILESFFLDTPAFDRPLRMLVIYCIAFLAVTLFLLTMNFDSALLANAIRSAMPYKLRAAENLQEISEIPDLENFICGFEENKYYREAGLTITGLAKKLQVPEYRLRTLINRHLGYRNFSAMLNKYRIDEACELLSDASLRNSSIYTIALDVGYQSIAPFNNAFRELKSLTPSEFRKRSLSKPGSHL